jgi:3-mercaptopyruvate sulfurtransferase SseA
MSLFPIRGTIAGVILIVMLAFISGLLFHVFYEGGFLSGKGVKDHFAREYRARFLPMMSYADLAHAPDGVVFIDARDADDYKAGHIGGAINIPPTATHIYRRMVMSGISRDAPIIVYCRSELCPSSTYVAMSLIDDDFNRVSIYKSGWDDWMVHHASR